MNISITQFVLIIFLLFAISRVYLRYKGGTLSIRSFIFWCLLFGLAAVAVIFPPVTGKLAEFIGIGRGVDAVIYTSIVLLFYLVFRLHIFIEDIRQEITTLIRKLALKEFEENEKNEKVSQN